MRSEVSLSDVTCGFPQVCVCCQGQATYDRDMELQYVEGGRVSLCTVVHE